MPIRGELEGHEMPANQIAKVTVALGDTTSTQGVTSDWQAGLPRLASDGVTLREVRVSDAPALFSLLTTDEVARFISPPPTSVAGFERFVEWAQRERSAGRYICFGIVPAGYQTAVGIIQVRQTDSDSFMVAEWGFAIGSSFWGTGLFQQAAALVLRFTFEVLGVHRLEARAVVVNGRGNGALRKIGAVQEGILRRSFLRREEFMDQLLWSILAEDWQRAKAARGPRSLRSDRVLAFTRRTLHSQ